MTGSAASSQVGAATAALAFPVLGPAGVVAVGLGLAVTLEFLGPLSVALLAARRVIDLGCALIAGAAAVVLARPQPSTDYAGIFLALLAAACWADTSW
jgi:inner membrane transporter RhtA